MYIDFDENRPDTPRVPSALTRLERILLAIVAYQALVLSYFLMPESFFVKPVRELLQPEQQLRYVTIEPSVDRIVPPKRPAPPSDIDRRAATPQPTPKAAEDPMSKGNTPEKITAPEPTPPQSAPASQPVTGPSPNEAPPRPPTVPGGILGSALRNLQRSTTQSQSYDNPEGGGGDQGSDIQFDSKGVDFGAWLRRFKAQVMNNWLIPEAANVMHGHVVIQMSILRNGTIVRPHIVQPSGIQAFDTAALTALKLSNPTMKLPEAYPGEAIDPFTVTFYYNERIR